MKNMKRFVWIASLLLFSCAGEKKEYHKAENALDAGREYIQACLEGDFSRAKFYTIADAANETQLALTEKAYREKDKEGRQQLRNDLQSLFADQKTKIRKLLNRRDLRFKDHPANAIVQTVLYYTSLTK